MVQFKTLTIEGSGMVPNGEYVRKEDYDTLKQKLDAVLAENVGLKAFPCQLLKFLRTLGTSAIGSQTYAKIETAVSKMKTPATDAILNEVRAEGAQLCIDAIVTSDSADFIDAPNICTEVIRQLRAGSTEGGV